MAVDSVRIKGRRYRFYGNDTFVRIRDEAHPWLQHMAREFPSELNRALRHVGWWARKELRSAIFEGGVAGSSWPPLSDVQQMRRIDDLKGRLRNPRTHPFGSLVRAIGYKHEPAIMRVRVGWLSRSAAAQGAKLQKGFTTQITPKMRRFFWAADIPLSGSKAVFRTPARPLFDPFFMANRRKIYARIESRILYYLNKSKKRARFQWAA